MAGDPSRERAFFMSYDLPHRIRRLERLVLSLMAALEQMIPISNFILPSTGRALIEIRDEIDAIDAAAKARSQDDP